MAERITPGSLKLSATFSYLKNGQSELKVTRDNAMTLQLIEVSTNRKTVEIGIETLGVFVAKCDRILKTYTSVIVRTIDN